MSVLTVFEPAPIPSAGLIGLPTRQVLPNPQALWRAGDILINSVTGTIAAPNANGALAAFAGPTLGAIVSPFNVTNAAYSVTQGVVTVTATASAAAPAQTLFVAVSYNGAANIESQLSTGFVINVPPGLLASVNVANTNAPGSATGYNLFASQIPNTFWRQAQGVAFATPTQLTAPLTNYQGAQKAAAGTSTGILGMADCDSDAAYNAPAGGSILASKRNVFGASQSYPPGWTIDPYQLPATPFQFVYLEMNLVQAWYNTQILAAVGLNIDANTGYFVADTTQTAVGVIRDKKYGPTRGDVGDTFARVIVAFNAAALAN